MALEKLYVYNVATGDNTYPHSGDFTITVAGQITVDDSNRRRDDELGDYTDTGSRDVPDQDVTVSSVAGINVGDTVDSRYTYTVTGSDGSSGNIYFLATNSATNYGSLIVSDFPLDPSVTYTFGTFNREGAVDYDDLVPCFAYGTLISTAEGDVPVQELLVGQEVLTLDREYKKIRWIGSRKLDVIDLKLNPKLLPIKIKSGAMGSGLPLQDLLVSPQHRVLVRSQIVKRMFDSDEILIPANKLVELNGIDVVQECEEIEYFHVLLDDHEIIFSNGAPTESLFTGPEALRALSPEARKEIETLLPEIKSLSYSPKPARVIPTKGKHTRKAMFRHVKNKKPLLSEVGIHSVVS
ncbi:Hint domain-containing protein (plasmid) [Falsihalocynthiibacter sp. SS001]|uniref:Hint domain-containing protein n=1 Tax=Falsihalocynthiibacter sp. SS001 TaxID=3349698 RepID=UPI0036D28EAC